MKVITAVTAVAVAAAAVVVVIVTGKKTVEGVREAIKVKDIGRGNEKIIFFSEEEL